MKIKAVRGTKDILPDQAETWRMIEEKARKICADYGYRQIWTPLLEEARLFTRSIGSSSDIVRKEMYTFSDRKKRVLCLRPEGTAAVVRAYLEHGLGQGATVTKLYYFGPMFRAERPQAGRLRQFHHIGVEAIGSLSPYLDAEVISLAVNILQEIGVKDFSLQLNSIGCIKDRQKYKTSLEQALTPKLKQLCADCHSRLKVNMLRIFDCKHQQCRKITQQLPVMIDFLCSECNEHYRLVKHLLASLNVAVAENPFLVRGLDYYTKTCFEIIHPQLGAQNALGAGGRYDNLVNDLGGVQTPAIGFALGLERIVAALEQKSDQLTHPTRAAGGVYIATI
ncbi:MAG: histidine--tRNA ligase, partial [Candidatus Omnitrophica bacterium]|nr:histidine--tRNA ligase [Candidatus Omnitrophota bacterium]